LGKCHALHAQGKHEEKSMDKICQEIYRYVLAKQKVCLFAVARDFKIAELKAKEYLEELLSRRLIKKGHTLNSEKHGPVLNISFQSPLLSKRYR
jgi:predicted DNA-binding transcriptional regulator